MAIAGPHWSHGFRALSVEEFLRSSGKARQPQSFPTAGFRAVRPYLAPCRRIHDPAAGTWSGSIVDAGSGATITYAQAYWLVPGIGGDITLAAFDMYALEPTPAFYMSSYVAVGSDSCVFSAGIDCFAAYDVDSGGFPGNAYGQPFLEVWRSGDRQGLSDRVDVKSEPASQGGSGSAFVAGPGDTLLVTIAVTNDWFARSADISVQFLNQTAGVGVGLQTSIPSTCDFAAWIVEAIGDDSTGQLYPFPPYGKLFFDDAYCHVAPQISTIGHSSETVKRADTGKMGRLFFGNPPSLLSSSGGRGSGASSVVECNDPNWSGPSFVGGSETLAPLDPTIQLASDLGTAGTLLDSSGRRVF
jgi:Peptidase A4 family